ncbi:MAG: zinc-binding dehydrogenase, partial [candidate division NC10 bacterium]|nr:zinc-binding dehydrogenase [candidate division NC10 bacterium]
EYVFTDLSNHFFLKAEEKFREYPFIKYQRLDIEADPCEQGFEAHSFDLILASHVLHATADLRQTLKNISRLLASEGMLVLVEEVEPVRWVEFVFGLMEGWWRYSDRDLRPFSHPLLPLGQWRELLEEVGFTDGCEVSGRKEHEIKSAVMVARGARFGQDESPEEPAESAGSESVGEGSWMIFADRGGRGHTLAKHLRSRGERCAMIFHGDAYQRFDQEQFQISARRPEDFRQVLQDVIGGNQPACRGVVHLWNLDAPAEEETTAESINEALVTGCLSVVHLAQASNEIDMAEVPRLWLVTGGAQSVGKEAEATSVTQAAVWGLGRVIVNEVPKLRTTMVDLSAAATDEEICALREELFVNDQEDEIALRGDARYVHRLQQSAEWGGSWRARDAARAETEPFRLETSKFGVLDKLTLRATRRRPPRGVEVEIRVVAAGLNFSDVMKALGIYPELPGGPVPLGIECAGKISAVGPDVEAYNVGDEVIAIAPFSFGAYVMTVAPLVVPKPPQYRFEEAATLPIAFLTAHYALNHLGRLSGGDRVLIHSATGGVGLAAIQLARQVGAEIFATAGTPEKRDFLRSLGIQHVMDSRSLAFADEVMERTGGQGVDVVLNSLSGEAIRKGLGILRDYGRFLEIGK